MNRAERRRITKENQKNPTLNIKVSDINKNKETATKDAVNEAVSLMLSIPVMVLHDKYGFGKKRLQKFTDQCLELFDSFNKGYVSFEDLINTLKEETGVEVKR
ncbi:MAG: hypothetical protein J6B63_04705 [Treponema sp.]|nr:hypothetical protein [Treponema sp.]